MKAPSEFITAVAQRECSLTLVPHGAVILGMIGQGKTRGMSAYLDIDACINQNLAVYAWNDRKWMFPEPHIRMAWQVLSEQGWLGAPGVCG